MIIMGLVLAFAGPRVAKGLLGLTIKTTTNQIAGALRYARSQAVNSGYPYNVIFDAEQQRVIVIRSRRPMSPSMAAYDNATETEPEDEAVAPAAALTKDIKTYRLPEGISFGKIDIDDAGDEEGQSDRIYQMTFFPDGTAQAAEIVLTDSDERTYYIDVEFLTGVVSVAEAED